MANSYGTATALSGNANSLANGAYVSLGVIDFSSTPPSDCLVRASMQAASTPSTTTSRSVIIYARSSLDGTTYSDDGAISNERNLTRLGFVSLVDTAAHVSKALSLALAFGALPPKVEIIARNDTGVALAASGQTGQYVTVTYG